MTEEQVTAAVDVAAAAAAKPVEVVKDAASKMTDAPPAEVAAPASGGDQGDTKMADVDEKAGKAGMSDKADAAEKTANADKTDAAAMVDDTTKADGADKADDPAKADADVQGDKAEATETPAGSDEKADAAADAAAEAAAAEAAAAEAAVAEADANDESWWGEGPAADVEKTVKDALGEEVSTIFVKAMRQLNGAKETVSRVLAASATFVRALKLVPEDLQTTAGFAELTLSYGNTLVRFVELEGTGSSAVAAKIVRALQSAAGGAAAGGRVVVDEDEGDADAGAAKGKDAADGAEEEEEEIDAKEGDEDEDMQMAWTQLEVARVIFARQKSTQREAECRAALGELLMACDEGKQSGAEFELAARLFEDGRRKAECLYKKYLSLRNGEQQEAIKSLREAVEVYEASGAASDVLADMKTELNDGVETMKAAEEEAKNGKAGDAPVEVVAVQPKRKRDVIAEQEQSNGKAAAEEDEKNGKKARVD